MHVRDSGDSACKRAPLLPRAGGVPRGPVPERPRPLGLSGPHCGPALLPSPPLPSRCPDACLPPACFLPGRDSTASLPLCDCGGSLGLSAPFSLPRRHRVVPWPPWAPDARRFQVPAGHACGEPLGIRRFLQGPERRDRATPGKAPRASVPRKAPRASGRQSPRRRVATAPTRPDAGRAPARHSFRADPTGRGAEHPVSGSRGTGSRRSRARPRASRNAGGPGAGRAPRGRTCASPSASWSGTPGRGAGESLHRAADGTCAPRTRRCTGWFSACRPRTAPARGLFPSPSPRTRARPRPSAPGAPAYPRSKARARPRAAVQRNHAFLGIAAS